MSYTTYILGITNCYFRFTAFAVYILVLTLLLDSSNDVNALDTWYMQSMQLLTKLRRNISLNVFFVNFNEMKNLIQ